MEKSNMINIKGLYRQPWSKNDNPNGWVEITTYCNMTCPGCYRGCDQPENIPRHYSLEEIKENILQINKIRNCQTISLSGGEPLLHPQILEIVFFIKQLGLNPVIFSNGSLISREKLVKLKEAGLGGFIIRVDSLREKRDISEVALNKLRQKHADMIASVGDLFLGFTCVIDNKNLDQIPEIIKWAQRNNEKVNLLVLILKTQIVFDDSNYIPDDEKLGVTDLTGTIASCLPDLKYSAYLGSEAEDVSIKWMQAYWVGVNGRVLAYTDKKFIELAQTYHHFRKGSYIYTMDKAGYFIPFLKLFLLSFINRSIKNVIKNYIKGIFEYPKRLISKPTIQMINIVNPPSFVNGERDLCDSCPDAILHEGKLQPSCVLEEITRFGKTFRVHAGVHQRKKHEKMVPETI